MYESGNVSKEKIFYKLDRLLTTVAAGDLCVHTINTSSTGEMDFMWLVPHSRDASQLQVIHTHIHTFTFTNTYMNKARDTERLFFFINRESICTDSSFFFMINLLSYIFAHHFFKK